MRKMQIVLAGAGAILGLLAWENWQQREELVQLRQASATQASIIATRPVVQPATPAANCPANPVVATSGKGLPTAPAPADTSSGPNHNTSTFVIPLGTNLLEALKMVQREQAKNAPPSTATISPFSTNQ